MSKQHLNFTVTDQCHLQSSRKWKNSTDSNDRIIDPSGNKWVALIVVVHKQDGDICICGDFKLTINLVICFQVYPLPTHEEMFSTLANGESFSKLDLARAYKRIKVISSQPLLTVNTHLVTLVFQLPNYCGNEQWLKYCRAFLGCLFY